MEKIVYVYENFFSQEPNLLGRLYINSERGKEIYSFEYDDSWLNSSKVKYVLDPNLEFYSGRQYPFNNNCFGVFSDSSPDRWGRLLLNRKERITANEEGRKPRKLLESDYLLGVYDLTRMGAIRLKNEPNGEFLSSDESASVPPWTTLRSLEEASRNFENDEAIAHSKWINQLINPGSSLGGARPKATVSDVNNELWIAKFPSKNDDYDVGAWEMIAHTLAQMVGLNVPDAKLSKFSTLGSTFLVKRFDRLGTERVHFSSAMTMLNKIDGDDAESDVSYLDIVSFLKANGANARIDTLELWKRIVFSMCISNIDDHLRNHGFILKPNGWVLSPMYDVNPVPYGNELSLNVDETSNRLSIDLAIDSAMYYGIEKDTAAGMANEIKDIVKNNWEKIAIKNNISRNGIEYMRPAFSECN